MAMTYRKSYVRERNNLKAHVMLGFAGELNAKPAYFADGSGRNVGGTYYATNV